MTAAVDPAVQAHQVLAAGPGRHDFTTRYGEPYRHDYYGAQIFRAAVTKAVLPSSTTTHDLRHHYASVLFAQGESVVVVAGRLGHENASLVLSTYGHLMPEAEDRTRRAIDGASSCAPDVPERSARSDDQRK